MRHRTSIALLAFGLLLPLGACSDDDDGGAVTADTDAADDTAETTVPPGDQTGGTLPGSSEGGSAISIEGFAFSDATAAAGAAVGVSNVDGTTHTVTSDDDAWEELRIEGGASGEITAPSEPGSYAFHCAIHPTMTGTLTVS